jgi:hypothetical protein
VFEVGPTGGGAERTMVGEPREVEEQQIQHHPGACADGLVLAEVGEVEQGR